MQKKKGSSLITVLIFMMFLMIVGVASITTTTMDYRMRNNESRRIENLYGAESGLEISYDILMNASDYAISEALNQTNTQFSYQQQNTNVDPLNIDDLFKATYLKTLLEKVYTSVNGEDNQNQSLVEYSLINLKYPIVDENQNLIFNDSGFDLSNHGIEITVEVLNMNQEIYSSLEELKKGFKVKVTSSYRSSDVNQYNSENERKISRIFEFHLPSYSTELVEMYPVFQHKILTVDGSINLAGSNNRINLTIDGDVWIGGNKYPQNSDYQSNSSNYVTYQKYENGLLLENTNVMLTGTLATKETISLYNNASLILNGNLYGKNVYAGKKNVGSLSQNVNLNVNVTSTTDGEVLLSNDLAVNVTGPIGDQSSAIEINKFYGVSDKNYEKLVGVTLDTLVNESSSIIVNGEGASINITEEAYIGGLAFLDVEDENGTKYQTGESVSVKPNYLAYSMILPGYEDKVEMKYYNPLMLIEGLDGSELDKSTYFYNVYDSNLLAKSAGGLKLPLHNTFAAGAIVSVDDKGDIIVDNAPGKLEVADVIRSKINQLKTEVSQMGYRGTEGTEDSNEFSVLNRINWESVAFINCPISSEKVCGDIILNTDDIKIKIEKVAEGHRLSLGDISIDIGDHIFLVTKGDLELVGNVDLIGNLIVGGHVDADSSMVNGNLKYNETYTKNLMFEYKETLLDLFNGVKKEESLENDKNQSYDSATIIKKGRWELKK